MTAPTDTLAALLVRLEAREQQIEAQAASVREQITELTARIGELAEQLEHVKITRKTLLELPEPPRPATPAVTSDPPEHPAYEQILTVLAAAGRPLRARDVAVAMDLPTTASNVNNARHKLKRLASRNLVVEVEQGLFSHASAQTTPRQIY